MWTKQNECSYMVVALKCLPVIIWNKNHSSKQVASMIYTFGKEIFAASTFNCKILSLRQSNILWSEWVLVAFLKKRRPKGCLWEVNLVFHR